MTLEEFVKKYNGKCIDYDGVYGAQCVDLFRQYCKEVLNISEHTGACSISGGAKDLFIGYSDMPIEQKYFKKSTAKNYTSGDVLVWNETKTNKNGHVAILLSKIGNSVIVFEQNGFSQDGAKIVLRSTENLLGYLRRKK